MEKPRFYSFGDFRLDAVEETLWRDGETLRINRRTFQVLRLLAENAGRLVSKQEFFETVWVGAAVEDNNLTVAVNTLRKVLGDDRNAPKYVENVSGKGYRFIAPVESLAETDAAVLAVGNVGKMQAAILPTLEVAPENKSINERGTSKSSGVFGRVGGLMLRRRFYAAVFGLIAVCLIGWAFTGESPAAHSTLPLENTDAHTSYTLARHHLEKRTLQDLPLAVKYFQQTAALKPDCAETYSGMAVAYALYSTFGVDAPKNSVPLAREAAAKALSLDANSAEALTAQAFIAYHFDYDWQTAERLFKRALELDSKSFIAHHWHGEFLNLTGKTKEGIAEIETALSLNPLSQAAYGDLAFGYYLARNYEKAIFYMNKSLEMERNSAITRYNLSEFNEMQGKNDEAAAEWLKAMALEEDDAQDINSLETAYKSKDFCRFSLAKAVWLERATTPDSYILATDIAKSYIGAGDNEKALTRLETAYEERSPDLIFIGHSPAYDRLRNELRFREIVKKMNF